VRNDVTNLTAAFRKGEANVIRQCQSTALVITSFFHTQNRQSLRPCDSNSASACSAHHLSPQDLWIIWEFMIYRFATLNLRIPFLKTESSWATLEVCVYVSQ